MLVFADLYGAADPAVEFWGPPSPVWSDTIGGGRLFLAQNMGQIYCGILAFLLIFGLGIARGLLWAREIRFFFIALIAGLIYALGWYTPIFRLMYDVLPGVELFRRPADATFIVGLMIAVNTGYLVHRLLSRHGDGVAAFPRCRSRAHRRPRRRGGGDRGGGRPARRRNRADRDRHRLCRCRDRADLIGRTSRPGPSDARVGVGTGLHRGRSRLEQGAGRIERLAAVALRRPVAANP